MRAPDFWQGDGFAARLLDPVGRLVGQIGAVHRRLVNARAVAVPVICVGNLTVGGAGKTPTVIAIAERLQALGETPHLLTRGYGGRAGGSLLVDPAKHDAVLVGDEALLLARTAPTWVSRDRFAGAKAAIAKGASRIVMDDGLQNPHLSHDLALLVVDGAVGFGNNRVLPAGPLREPVNQGLARVDAVIRIGPDMVGLDRSLPAGLPRLEACLKVAIGGPDLEGRRVLAFAGIGRPEKFFKTLQEVGADLVRTEAFPDHHPFKSADIEALLAQARQLDACCVTTEKDHVRLPLTLRNQVEKLPVKLWFREPARLDRMLAALVAQ